PKDAAPVSQNLRLRGSLIMVIRNRFPLVAALSALGAVAALLPSAAAAQQVIIVSAGDSYASGEGAPDGGFLPIWRGANTDFIHAKPWGSGSDCRRSGLAAAAQTAGRLAVFKPVT